MKIQINKPCHEDWNKMRSLERDKFCAKCNVVVKDFTVLKKEEIEFELSQKIKGRVCGRFRENQLKTNYDTLLPELILDHPSKFIYLKKGVCSMLLLGLVGCSTIESENNNSEIEGIGTETDFEEYEEAFGGDAIKMGMLVTEKPEFLGGIDSLMAFIKSNFSYPEQAKRDSIEGKVYVAFTVDTNCYITNAKVVRSAHPLLDQEALRLVNSLPKYDKPGMQSNKTIPMQYTLPFNFKLKED